MKRAPVEETKRAPFTKAQKVAILAKSDGHCAYPGCFETKGLELDHIIPRWMKERANTVENGQALCEEHHAMKTALDAKIRARTKRLIKAEAGEKKPTTIRSRGFPPGKRTLPSRPFPKRKT